MTPEPRQSAEEGDIDELVAWLDEDESVWWPRLQAEMTHAERKRMARKGFLYLHGGYRRVYYPDDPDLED